MVPSSLVLYEHLRTILEKTDQLINDKEPEEEKCSLLKIAHRVSAKKHHLYPNTGLRVYSLGCCDASPPSMPARSTDTRGIRLW